MLFLLLIISLLILIMNRKVEHYSDLVPYDKHWDMFKCFTNDCMLKKSYDCYSECDKIDELGGNVRLSAYRRHQSSLCLAADNSQDS